MRTTYSSTRLLVNSSTNKKLSPNRTAFFCFVTNVTNVTRIFCVPLLHEVLLAALDVVSASRLLLETTAHEVEDGSVFVRRRSLAKLHFFHSRRINRQNLPEFAPAGDKTSLRVPHQSGYFGPRVRLHRTASSVTSDWRFAYFGLTPSRDRTDTVQRPYFGRTYMVEIR